MIGLVIGYCSEEVWHKLCATQRHAANYAAGDARQQAGPMGRESSRPGRRIPGDGVRLGTEQRGYGPGDVVIIPDGTEHEAWFREDTSVIDFFAPLRDDFLLGGKPAYMSED
jgi:hypothetical protein